jgi:hypothetical protein
MGNNQSQNRSQEEEDRFWREGEEMKRQEEEEARRRNEEAAAAAAADAERRRKEQLKIEQEQRAKDAEANRLKTVADFTKPISPTLALTWKTSTEGNPDIQIQAGLSSSTVVLTRDILGKKSVVYPQPPGNLDSEDQTMGKYRLMNFHVPSGDYELLGNAFLLEDTEILSVLSRYPDRDFPDVWVKGRPARSMTVAEWKKSVKDQIAEFETNMLKFKDQNTPYGDKKVLIWNPADKAGDKSAVAINYKTHGALTKVFLKPTIPFSITYVP